MFLNSFLYLFIFQFQHFIRYQFKFYSYVFKKSFLPLVWLIVIGLFGFIIIAYNNNYNSNYLYNNINISWIIILLSIYTYIIYNLFGLYTIFKNVFIVYYVLLVCKCIYVLAYAIYSAHCQPEFGNILLFKYVIFSFDRCILSCK